ncbi:MAG: hypothetical protein ACRCUM_04000 [Mycoplasmoidaceae bacterium]
MENYKNVWYSKEEWDKKLKEVDEINDVNVLNSTIANFKLEQSAMLNNLKVMIDSKASDDVISKASDEIALLATEYLVKLVFQLAKIEPKYFIKK